MSSCHIMICSSFIPGSSITNSCFNGSFIPKSGSCVYPLKIMRSIFLHGLPMSWVGYPIFSLLINWWFSRSALFLSVVFCSSQFQSVCVLLNIFIFYYFSVLKALSGFFLFTFYCEFNPSFKLSLWLPVIIHIQPCLQCVAQLKFSLFLLFKPYFIPKIKSIPSLFLSFLIKSLFSPYPSLFLTFFKGFFLSQSSDSIL